MKFFHLAISPCTNPEGEKNGEEKRRKEKKIDSQMNGKKLWMKNYINKLLISAFSFFSLLAPCSRLDSSFTVRLETHRES